MGDALTIAVRSERDHAIATIAGEIDISTVGQLRERLSELAASRHHLVIDMIRLLRRCGLEVEDLLELRPAPGATASHPLVTIEWARQWPCEEVWKARRTGRA